MSDKKKLVLSATKREMREVCVNPSSVMHYALLCKDESPKANTSHDLPLVLSFLLHVFQVVFLDELPRDYHHYEASNTESTSTPEHLYLTRLPTASTPRKLRRSNDKYNNPSTTVMYMKA